MKRLTITHTLALLTIVALLSGCGGGEDNRSRDNVVITPAAPAAEPAEEPAADESASAEESAAAEPQGDAVAVAEAAAESKPEMKEAESTSATEVAAATPAETPSSAAAAAPPAAESAAAKGTTFKGRVVVKGTPPPSTPIKPSGNDAFCLAIDEIQNDEVIVGEGNGLADVVVWVQKVPDGVEVPDPPTEPAVLDQKGCRFIPPALAVQIGQPFLVKNDDATLHNTRMSGFDNSFNMTVKPNNRDGELVKLSRPERFLAPIKCDIHGWMSARVLVTDNPWHAITDKDGHFEIHHLPAGVELDFRLMHAKGYVEKSVELTFEDGEVKEQTFEMDATQLAK